MPEYEVYEDPHQKKAIEIVSAWAHAIGFVETYSYDLSLLVDDIKQALKDESLPKPKEPSDNEHNDSRSQDMATILLQDC